MWLPIMDTGVGGGGAGVDAGVGAGVGADAGGVAPPVVHQMYPSSSPCPANRGYQRSEAFVQLAGGIGVGDGGGDGDGGVSGGGAGGVCHAYS